MMIEIDGSYLEGGGQIIRTALALATTTSQAFTANNIRAGRKQPGLKNQHLNCIKILENLCNSESEGCELGSTSIKYLPGKIHNHEIESDIGTAGSITLLFQSILLPVLFSNKKTKFKITGGTDVEWSMPFDYMKEILLPPLQKYAEIKASIYNRGYFPKGQGIIELEIKPKYKSFNEAPELNLVTRGKLLHIKGVSHASSDLSDARVSERQVNGALSALRDCGCPVHIRTEYRNTTSTGSGITLWAIFSKPGYENEIDFDNPVRLGADCLGKKGMRAESVGDYAARQLLKEIKSGACVDQHLADNLIPLMGLVGGQFLTSELTNHSLSNVWVTEKFVKSRFEIKDNLVKCHKVTEEIV